MGWLSTTFSLTFTCCAISSESLFTRTGVKTITVGAISVLITWTGFCRTLVDIWWERDGRRLMQNLVHFNWGKIKNTQIACSEVYRHFQGMGKFKLWGKSIGKLFIPDLQIKKKSFTFFSFLLFLENRNIRKMLDSIRFNGLKTIFCTWICAYLPLNSTWFKVQESHSHTTSTPKQNTSLMILILQTLHFHFHFKNQLNKV